jgi:cyclase
VKTVRFGGYSYVGDPINTVRIFNELEVDELCFLDIRASVETSRPNLKILREISEECFMPLSYGGGVRDLGLAKDILRIGFEKIVVNTYAYEEPLFISRLADHAGSQAVIGSIDVKRGFMGGYQVYSHAGTRKTGRDPVEWAVRLQELGAGELLLTSMDRDGTWSGFDLEITRRVSAAVSVPVIANGGAGAVRHIHAVVKEAGASAVALGSMVVYQSKGMGVLVSCPNRAELQSELVSEGEPSSRWRSA